MAKAERVEGTRYLAEAYCAKQIGIERLAFRAVQDNQDTDCLFLSNNDLSVIGTCPQIITAKHAVFNSPIPWQRAITHPQNNSP